MGFLENNQETFVDGETKRKFRGVELRALVLVSIALLLGLFLVYQAKTQRPENFSEIPAQLSGETTDENNRTIKKTPDLLNLSAVGNKDELLPFLTDFERREEREFAAEKIFARLSQQEKLVNVGALSAIRVTADELKNRKNLDYFVSELEKAQIAAEERRNRRAEKKKDDPLEWARKLFKPEAAETVRVPVIRQIGSVKSSFIVRAPGEYFRSLMLYSAVFFLSFFGLHLFWQMRGFRGDQLLLPSILALCGIGFLMMVSLRDPLRDSLSFADFAWGVAAGCIVLGAVTSIDYYSVYYRLKSGLKFTDFLIAAVPISVSLFLCLALILVGTGPGTSDAKVNLALPGFVFQPSELIKILICFFIAAYFSHRWELIQNLDEKKFRFLSIPRVRDVWIVLICVAMVLALFVFQKDLGPALLMSGTFLIVFAIVRSQTFLSIAGFALIIASYAFNYYVYRFSQTAADRIDIWSSPWDTSVRGGEQIVHSFWALASGGFWGTGLGLGDPNFAPAAHTDLILSSIGEELGFAGLFLVFVLYGTLFYRSFQIALGAVSAYSFFLALNLAAINALQILFISAGVLGVVPLSGVVSPFLSYGSTSMVMNFFAFGVLLVISSQSAETKSKEITETFTKPTRYLLLVFAGLAAFILANAAWIQIWKADEISVKSVLAPQPNEVVKIYGTEKTLVGIRRYQDNPRIRQLLKELPYGTIYDRRGIPLASSKWDELVKHRREYEDFGIRLEDVCDKGSRCYPFGARIFHLLGDVRTRKNWSASNSAYIEKEYESKLRGFSDNARLESIKVKQRDAKRDEQTGETIINAETNQPEIEEKEVDFPVVRRDYRELIPLLRYRYLPLNLEAYRLRYAERNLQTSIDIRLQLRLTEILQNEIKAKREKRGAIVVLDPQNGDLLASVSYPFYDDEPNPAKNRKEGSQEEGAELESDRLFDRALFGLYPPGSTFKIVTALAALRKDAAAAVVAEEEFSCVRLSDGRVGQVVRGRPVRDDIQDRNPHGAVKLREGIIHSCNAYFAQLGSETTGAETLFTTAGFFNINVGEPNTPLQLNKYLAQSAYGQGEVTASPFQMAKVAATVANQGTMSYGRWITDENNLRAEAAKEIINPNQARIIADAMRGVVTEGTGRSLLNSPVQIAGKTGTAETRRKDENGKIVPADSHSWFIGFAPYNDGGNSRIAFAVIVENGGYGGGIAARISGEVVRIAKELEIIR